MNSTMRLAAAAAALLAASVAHGQAFSNLGFEAADVSANSPPFGFLDWASAVPGWTHNSGDDTGSVYYGLTHVGVTPWFLLADASSQPTNLLAGQYSMVFANGYAFSNSQNAPWIYSYLAQSGVLPVGTQSLTLLAKGSLEFYVNGNLVPLVALGGLQYGADISAYAGSLVELRFMNSSNANFDPVVLDSVTLSNTALVPEPGSWALFGVGLMAVAHTRRRGASSKANG